MDSTGTFTDLFANVNAALQATFTSASTGMSNYVIPLGWAMFGVSILVWSFMVMTGRVASPANEWMMKGAAILLILSAAGANYSTWVSGPLFQLPNDLANAIGSSGTPAQVLDMLETQLNQMLDGIASAVVSSFSNLNFGGGIILFAALVIVSIACALLLIGAAFNVLYAQIGLSLVLSVGPFFIIWMIWKQTQHWAWSWLNTALYYVFLTVLSAMFILLFIQICTHYMSSLESAVTALGPTVPSDSSFAAKLGSLLEKQVNPQAQIAVATSYLNIFSISLQLAFICLPMFFIEIQLPTIAASMTGGQGGSVGSGFYMVMQAARTAAAFKGGK
jgi:type IV secretion system protein VirB6